MGFTFMERRGTTYYFRIRIPTELREHFGRLEVRRSLSTGDHRKAKALVRIAAAKAEIVFEKMRRDTMTKAELRKIADDYLHSTLVSIGIEK